MLYIAYPSETPEEIKRVFQELEEGFEITTPKDRHEIERDEFVDKSEDLLKNSEVFIVEASKSSIGLEIETNWAHENQVPILLFVKEGKDYPEKFKDIHLKVRHYTDPEDLRKKLMDFLTEEYPGESKQEYFQYGDKKQYQSFKKGWERRYKK